MPTFYPIAKEQVKNNYPNPKVIPVHIYDSYITVEDDFV